MKYGLSGRFMGKLMRIKQQKVRRKNWGFIQKIERSSSIKYRRELDGLRAIAIIFVVSTHTQLLSWGSLGVDIFFVLSGYLITDVLLNLQSSPIRLKKFYFGRFARLFPVLTLYTLLGSIVSFMLLREWFNFAQPLTALLQIKNFFKLSDSYHDVWAHTWSLSAEEQFYVIWPFLLFLCINRLKRSYFLIFVTVYVFMAHMSLLIANNLWADLLNRSFDYGSQFISVIIRPSEILIGCIITLSRSFPRFIVLWLFATATCITVIFGMSGYLAIALSTATLLAILEMSTSFSRALCWILSRQVFVSIGVLSYSIYLWHVLIYEVVFEYFGYALGIKFIILAITFVVSYISYTCFEMPLQKIINRKLFP
jgi:peptidoglycan/LPS O-acetylase OafA/YrhL